MKSRRRRPSLIRRLLGLEEPAPPPYEPPADPAAAFEPADDPPGATAVYPFAEEPEDAAPPPPAEERGLWDVLADLFDGEPLFSDSRGHLEAELRRVGYLVRLLLRRSWDSLEPDLAGGGWGDVSATQAVQAFVGREALLRGEIAAWATDDAYDPDWKLAAALQAEIDGLRRARGNQADLRLMQLAERFSLTPREIDVILIALLPELHRRFRLYFAHLQQDSAQPLPNVNTIHQLLAAADPQRPAGFRADRALLPHRLILLDGEATVPSPLPQVQVEAWVVAFLLGGAGPYERLNGLVAVEHPPATAAAPPDLTQDERRRLARFRHWDRERRTLRRQRATRFYEQWRQDGDPDGRGPAETPGAKMCIRDSPYPAPLGGHNLAPYYWRRYQDVFGALHDAGLTTINVQPFNPPGDLGGLLSWADRQIARLLVPYDVGRVHPLTVRLWSLGQIAIGDRIVDFEH